MRAQSIPQVDGISRKDFLCVTRVSRGCGKEGVPVTHTQSEGVLQEAFGCWGLVDLCCRVDLHVCTLLHFPLGNKLNVVLPCPSPGASPMQQMGRDLDFICACDSSSPARVFHFTSLYLELFGTNWIIGLQFLKPILEQPAQVGTWWSQSQWWDSLQSTAQPSGWRAVVQSFLSSLHGKEVVFLHGCPQYSQLATVHTGAALMEVGKLPIVLFRVMVLSQV